MFNKFNPLKRDISSKVGDMDIDDSDSDVKGDKLKLPPMNTETISNPNSNNLGNNTRNNGRNNKNYNNTNNNKGYNKHTTQQQHKKDWFALLLGFST